MNGLTSKQKQIFDTYFGLNICHKMCSNIQSYGHYLFIQYINDHLNQPQIKTVIIIKIGIYEVKEVLK